MAVLITFHGCVITSCNGYGCGLTLLVVVVIIVVLVVVALVVVIVDCFAVVIVVDHVVFGDTLRCNESCVSEAMVLPKEFEVVVRFISIMIHLDTFFCI